MRRTSTRPRARRERRGSALILTLIITMAIAALSMAAIYMSGSASLIGKMSEKERDLRYGADAALQMGKSRLNNDPGSLPDSGYTAFVSNGTLSATDGSIIPNVTFNLYAGPTGSTTGQFGRFASVVAEAVGPRGAKFVRRLELMQESFARYAYWTNQEKNTSGGTIYFANGDVLWGPVWSNDIITIHSTGATFNDDVGTAQTISGAGNGTFKKGYTENQPSIVLPTLTKLASLPGYATAGNFNFAAPSTGDETTVRMRIEFVSVDLNADGDSTDVDEGFFRVYKGDPGTEQWVRGDWQTNIVTATTCGDWHPVVEAGVVVTRFFPASIHNTAWAKTLWQGTVPLPLMTNAQATAEQAANLATIMGHANARCFLGGDPYLRAIEGNSAAVAAARVGGSPTTFTANGVFGDWQLWPGAIDPRVTAARPADAAYLFPLYRGQNAGSKGVIYLNGTIGISGQLRGRVTLYSTKTVVLLDDLRYQTDPASGRCNDMLGVISGDDIKVADNALNDPPMVGAAYKNVDDTKDFFISGVLMALSESFGVENHDAGPTDANDCGVTTVGRGCLFLTGGIIQERRGAVGQTDGHGFIKRYSYDRCAIQIPPPYFPTTGRFFDNRYSEIDPGRFNVTTLFQELTPY